MPARSARLIGPARLTGARPRAIMAAVHAAQGRALSLTELARLSEQDGNGVQIAPLVWWMEQTGYLARVPGPWWCPRWTVPRLGRTWPHV